MRTPPQPHRLLQPQLKGPPFTCVPSAHGAKGAPQHEYRDGDALPGQSIRMIVLAVDAGCRPILLADGMRVLQITQRVSAAQLQLFAGGLALAIRPLQLISCHKTAARQGSSTAYGAYLSDHIS